MKPKILLPLLVLGVVAFAGMWTMNGYNSMVSAQEEVDGAWAQVETQYQRRFDLIPFLVNAAKGAADFEQETFTAVTAARSQWQQADATGNRDEQIAAATTFDSALSRLLVTVESYPELKATDAYRDLLAQTEGTENRIATARQRYNDIVRTYNVSIKRFPTNVLASLFGFDEEEFFESTPGADMPPDVEF